MVGAAFTAAGVAVIGAPDDIPVFEAGVHVEPAGLALEPLRSSSACTRGVVVEAVAAGAREGAEFDAATGGPARVAAGVAVVASAELFLVAGVYVDEPLSLRLLVVAAVLLAASAIALSDGFNLTVVVVAVTGAIDNDEFVGAGDGAGIETRFGFWIGTGLEAAGTDIGTGFVDCD